MVSYSVYEDVIAGVVEGGVVDSGEGLTTTHGSLELLEEEVDEVRCIALSIRHHSSNFLPGPRRLEYSLQ